MNIRVITPFHRRHLAGTLKYYLRPMRIQWYPIMAPSEWVEFNESWIHPLQVREREPDEGIAYKQNWFIDTQPIIDGDYYCSMMDDDMYEPGFFDMVRRQTAKIIVFSLYRGDTIPSDDQAKHHTHPLVIRRPEQMRPGHIDIMQYIVKGEIFKRHRFIVEHHMADGVYAQMLAETYPNDIVFKPDWYGLFNYFQFGRYNNRSKFPKDNWVMPKYIWETQL